MCPSKRSASHAFSSIGHILALPGVIEMTYHALDAKATRAAVAVARPDAIIYQATALADLSDFKHVDRSFAQTNRLRTDGTDILLAAARAAGVRPIVAQSYACHRYARAGGPVKTEDDPLDPVPPTAMRQTIAALNHLDQAVTAAGGIALRYGNFYGDPNDGLVAAVRAQVPDHRRRWRHLVAHPPRGHRRHRTRTRARRPRHLQHRRRRARPRRRVAARARQDPRRPTPQHYPRLLARLFAGEALVVMATESRGASNAKAKRELGWTLRYPSWRQGFTAAYGQPTPLKARG